MTNDEAIEKLKVLQESCDTEMAHGFADDVLCDLLLTLGYDDAVKEYHKIEKWFA